MRAILVTGGAGFIGSAVIRHLINDTHHRVINVDKLTYAGNIESLSSVSDNSRYHFEQVDICNANEIARVFHFHQPDIIMHLAAESHVDRSIDGPGEFIQTNIVGTYNLLEQARRYWAQLAADKKASFRFHHISTDEVYGSLGASEPPFVETNVYAPNSPYSASKASSDHLVRAYHHTYGLPVLTTNCSNNYGPLQFPEKLIPLVIYNALQEKPLPVYGNGLQIRDWLYVRDHCAAIKKVLAAGMAGEVYNVGGSSEKTNLDVVKKLCDLLDMKRPLQNGSSYRSLITHVPDRLGHDSRYAVDAGKLQNTLAWNPVETFETGVEKTVDWYLANGEWVKRVVSGDYKTNGCNDIPGSYRN